MVLYAEVIMKKKGSEYNNILLEYLENNIDRLNEAKIVFEFLLFTDDDEDIKDELRDRNIRRFPAMTIGNNKYFGPKEIKSELNSLLRRLQAQEENKSTEDRISEWQMNTIMEGKTINGDKIAFDDGPEDDEKVKNELSRALLDAKRNRDEKFGKVETEQLNKVRQKQRTRRSTNNKDSNISASVSRENNLDVSAMDIAMNNPNSDQDDFLLANMLGNAASEI